MWIVLYRTASVQLCFGSAVQCSVLTQYGQGFVSDVVEGPHVGGPVGVAQASLEGEEAGEHLR